MFEIIKREMIVPNLHLMTIHSPDIAEQVRPGQFVIIRSDEQAERIPLSIADWDRKSGTITVIFMEVGSSTSRLAALQPGQAVPSVVGPLGKPTEIEKFGTVVCVAGCYGIGSIFPVIRELHEKGNRVTAVLEARSSFLLYWMEKIKPCCAGLVAVTRDGSAGFKGHVKNVREILTAGAVKPDRIIVNGCSSLLYKTTLNLRELNVPIIVSLNPIMIDGTGMCGVCRVSVEGKMKFACVDGPEFDGRLIDWDEFFKRRAQYTEEEMYQTHHGICGGA